MAWPLSRYQDFVDNTVPAIAAAFLHALQDAQGHVYRGTQTLKALVVDGTGGVAATPNAGDIVASRDVSAGRSLRSGLAVAGTTAPTTKVDAGEIPLSCVPVGWARLAGNHTLLNGVNVYAVDSGLGNGVYRVTFDRVLSTIYAAPSAVMLGTSANLHLSCTVDNGGAGGRVRLTVSVFDSGGTPTDANGIAMTLFGE